jgi:antitoxin VapB
MGYEDILSVVAGYPKSAMPLYIKDNVTASLVGQLATRLGLSKQDAVKRAVEAELERTGPLKPRLRETYAALRAAYPLPPATGDLADKTFYDDLSGDL